MGRPLRRALSARRSFALDAIEDGSDRVQQL
jgi:hypothetical protein